MSSDKNTIIYCQELKIFKPKPRKVLSYTSRRIFSPRDSFLKCPFSSCDELKSKISKKEELLFKSSSIDDIEKDFCSLKEEREKMKNENSYLRDSTSIKTNCSEDEQIVFVEIVRPENPFYKNFD